MPPLPAPERLSGDATIAVTLRLNVDRVSVGETPIFTLVVRNTGSQRLWLKPHAASNLRVFTTAGALVEGPGGGIFDYAGDRLRPADLVGLEPGKTHEFRVLAEYHASTDFSGVSSYMRDPSGDTRLYLPTGDYSLRFTYINYPDYGPSTYDVYEAPPNVWEGRIDAPPASLTVLPLEERQISGLIEQIDRDAPAKEAIDLARLGRVTAAIEPLLRRFQRVRDDRQDITVAIHDLDGGKSIPRLLALTSALPAAERREVIFSTTFASVARDAPTCDSGPLLLEAINSLRGDVDILLGEAIGAASRKCPRLTAELRAILRAPNTGQEDDIGRRAYRRAHAAEALGRAGSVDDVALLLPLLKRAGLGAPPPSPNDGDLTRRAAIHALGRLGGRQAERALMEELSDEGGNRSIMGDIVDAVTRLRPAGAGEGVARVLASNDPSVLIRAIIGVQHLGATVAIPRLRTLVEHSNSSVRVHAGRALAEMGQPASTAVDTAPGAARQIALSAGSRNWRARTEAAEAIGRSDKTRAAWLLLRELGNRQIAPCRHAVNQLRKLLQQPAEVDCTNPADRGQALERFTSLLGHAR